MKHVEILSKYYTADELRDIIMYCVANQGVVHVDNDCFFCAYPTSRGLIEIEYKKELDKPDTWYVYIASGNLKKAFAHIKPKQYLAFRRFDDRFRIYDFEKFRRLVWATQEKR